MEQKNSNNRAAWPYDYLLLAAVMVLMGFSLVMIYSATAVTSELRFHDPNYYLKKQLVNIGAALVSLIVGMCIYYQRYSRWVYIILASGIIMLFLVLIPGIGVTAGGSTRWLGIYGATFEPSEFVKLAFIIYLSYSLAKKSADKIRSFSVGFLPHLIVCGVIILLCLAQPDLGTAVVLATMMFILLFVAGTRVSYLVLVVFISVPVLIKIVSASSSRMRRILAFMDPWQYRYDEAFQIVNSIASFGSGGLFGFGLGNGRQKNGFVPEAQTDFILPIIGEELGFVGVVVTVGLLAFLVHRGVRLAFRCRNDFGRYLAFGVATLLGVQAIINVGVALALLPTKGLTLPFVSYGGSSLVVCCFAAGILLNISRHVEVEQLVPKPSAPMKRKRFTTKRRRKTVRQSDRPSVKIFVGG